MTTRFTDGCVKTTTVTGAGGTYGAVTGPFGGAGYVAAKGRFGIPGLKVNGTGGSAQTFYPDRPTTIFTNFAFQVEALTPTILWSAFDSIGNARQVQLAMTAIGQLVFQLGNNTQIGALSSQTFLSNTIYFLEIKTVIDPANGTVEARLNGNTTPILSTTGVKTTNTANTWLDEIRFEASGVNTYFSDIHVFDTNSPAPSTYIGNKRIYTLVPANDSATGGLNQFSTSPAQAAGSHYKNVDEEPPDGDTSYNNTSTPATRESYQVTQLPANASGVSVVNVWAQCRIDDAGPHIIQVSSRSAATDSFSPNINPAATYTYYNLPQSTDPSTAAAWTVPGVNASEIGIELVS